MRSLGRILTITLALLGGITLSQAPEFTQQYRQRIGGALDELRIIISAFDAQATQNGLDRQKALSIYAISSEKFLRDQGDMMRMAFERYGRLSEQQRELSTELPIGKPLLLLRHADPVLLANTWRDYVPAVPIDAIGWAWAAAGALCGWALAALLGAGRRALTHGFRSRHA